MYYQFPYAQYQPGMFVAPHNQGGRQASNSIPPETEEQISPTNTTFNAPGVDAGPTGPRNGQPNPDGNAQGGNNGVSWEQQGNGVNDDCQGCYNDPTNNRAAGDWRNKGNGDWNGNNDTNNTQDNPGSSWNEGQNNQNAQTGDDNVGDSGWDNDDSNNNNANENWNNANNTTGNEQGGSWGADDANTNANPGGGDWKGSSGGSHDQQNDAAVADVVAHVVDAPRNLYGPHGPYYSLRALRLDEPRPDAEEEPRYDVPKPIAVQRGSTKQVQPGPGYRYFKKRMIPEYVDSMETPYARFVFKYRTKGEPRTTSSS